MIALRIKELRELAGDTQKGLAKKLGVSRTSVTGWENGTSCPTALYLIELSKLYGKSVDYILGLDQTDTLCLDEFNQNERQLMQQLWKYIRSQNTEQQT